MAALPSGRGQTDLLDGLRAAEAEDWEVAAAAFDRAAAAAKGPQEQHLRSEALIRGGEAQRYRNDFLGATERITAGLALAQQQGAPTLIALGLRAMGQLSWRKGDAPTARELFVQALQIAKGAGDEVTVALVWQSMGDLHSLGEGIVACRIWYLRALPTLASAGLWREWVRAQCNLALLYLHCGAAEEALAVAQEALALLRSPDHRGGRPSLVPLHIRAAQALLELGQVEEAGQHHAAASRGLGAQSPMVLRAIVDQRGAEVAAARGEVRAALAQLEVARMRFHELGSALDEVEVLIARCRVLLGTGDLQELDRSMGQGLALLRAEPASAERAKLEEVFAAAQAQRYRQGTLPPPRGELPEPTDERVLAARVAAAAGDLQTAMARLEGAIDDRSIVGVPRALALLELGQVLASLGQLPSAARTLLAALEVAHGSGDLPVQVEVRRALAMVHWRRGDTETAKLLLTEALEVSRSLGDVRTDAKVLQALGDVYHARMEPVEAVWYYRAADHLLQATGQSLEQARLKGNTVATFLNLEAYRSAEATVRQALEQLPHPAPAAAVSLLRLRLAEVMARQGKVAPSEEVLRQVEHDPLLAQAAVVAAVLAETRAHLAAAKGDLPSACQLLEVVITDFSAVSSAHDEVLLLVHIARWQRHLGAQALLEQTLRRARALLDQDDLPPLRAVLEDLGS